MTMSLASSNITNTTSDSNYYFCTKMPTGVIAWVIFSVPCACVGVPASVYLLWVLAQRQHSGSFNNEYMLNLTIIDLIYNVLGIPSVLNFLVFHDFPLYSAVYFFAGFNYNGRPLFMACSCVDCYMAVVHPIRYMRIRQSRYRTVVCMVVWVSTLAIGLLFNFFKDQIHLSIWNIPCLFAISAITFCDVFVLHSLRKPDPSGRTGIHPQKQRALQTIINSFAMTLVSYLPMVLVLTLSDVIPLRLEDVYCRIYLPSFIFPVLGSAILPLLYLSNLGRLDDLRRCACI